MTIITNEGKKLITQAILNKLDLFISKVVYADCNLDVLNEDTLSLTNIKYENLPTSVRINEVDSSQIILEAVLRNDAAQDFFINCVGFVAKNGELLCFSKINRTFVQSTATDTNASLFHYKLAIELENANDLSIKIDETIVYPTLTHFNASQKAQDELIAKLVLDKVNTSDFTASQNLQDEKINALENNKAEKLQVFTRDEINVKLNAKADKATTYTKTEVDTSQNAQNTKISALETNKADKTSVYTKLETDAKVNALNTAKADKATTYTKTEVDIKDKVALKSVRTTAGVWTITNLISFKPVFFIIKQTGIADTDYHFALKSIDGDAPIKNNNNIKILNVGHVSGLNGYSNTIIAIPTTTNLTIQIVSITNAEIRAYQ